MSFSGRRGEFLKMLVAGSLYQIPTFGFYRFWLTTKLRRHLWANTQIAGEPFEYTGTAKELLIGFLIALAVLAPLYIVVFVLSFVLEERAAFASIPLILVMYVLVHFGSYRARRYRATRTVFRGVRFWMQGSGWAYALRAILWDFANLFTLGLAWPWAAASLERYRMRHTYFGNVQGDFSGTGWTLFKRGVGIWALGLIVLGGAIASSVHLAKLYPEYKEILPLIGSSIALAIIALLWPFAMAIFTRWHIDGLRFGETVVSSSLKARSYYALFLKMSFAWIGFGIFANGVGFVGFYVLIKYFGFDTTHLSKENWTLGGFIAIAAFYLFLMIGLGVIRRYFLGRGLWAAVVKTTRVSSLHAADAAIAAGRPAGVMGEGLADALDFNVGI